MSCGLSGDVVDINLEIKAPEVNMFMPTGLYRKIRAAAGKRDVPLNVIVNSAIAPWLANRGLVDIRPLWQYNVIVVLIQ